GSHGIDWDDLIFVSTYFMASPWATLFNTVDRGRAAAAASINVPVGGSLLIMHDLKQCVKGNEDSIFRYAVMQGRKFEASEPRDKIYALLGISEGSLHRKEPKRLLSPDYALSDSKIYT